MDSRDLSFTHGLALLISEVHAYEDKEGAEEEPDGDLFVEQPPGKEDGGDGVEIDPVGGKDSSQFADDPVPEDVADHGGYNAQEQEVKNN